MLDFTSAHYLGSPRFAVPAGLPLSTGRPAALQEPGWHRQVAAAVARRQGLETGLLAPSTLHLFWDVLALAPTTAAVFIDQAMYPVGQWGAARAALRGLPVVPFSADNNDLAALGRLLHTYRQQGRTPWLLTDGWRPGADGPAPLARYQDLLRPDPRSVLLIDDTQAFGVVGEKPTVRQPLGRDGGGSLAYLGVRGPHLLCITSLAKGLGVPVAVLTGSRAWVARLARRGATRVHSSPVSNWHAWAAGQALQRDASGAGDAARQQLALRIGEFRRVLHGAGWAAGGGWFPVQKLALPTAAAALGLHCYLEQQGIRGLLLANAQRPAVPQVAFCLRADHSAADVARLTGALLAWAAGAAAWSFTPNAQVPHEADPAASRY
ncbi:aminotransferase class I/II-fold pyridoxal phosphate-dependent enzyme [Hymenobacter weizhouensis]|uniref:aminotransferase class I/II-fold pyridoxal phosphate-dependent enzyme n=1 Tax=Hymenobacter sp. YIM 151500-1 TaxID=2987689 RepID=UPI002227C8ED|nr:aminotransferase class I/II-fold pyridoxal phosphate-dependent enzyme [Hymenobacter sp. YIM 151500-1]UYZ64293.1 aminotransferase class I/II-fold pyridoxal phosphate-dependent enzyme [Hymenobacter sp. YIM 151500-1]